MTIESNSSASATATAERIDEAAIVREARRVGDELKAQIGRQIIGQEEVITQLLVGFFAGGHALLVGVPGLAKTMLVRSLAQATHLSFRRIQFTPDLMPADITGTHLLEEDQATGKRSFRFATGPLFAQVVLADEINRTPPKTQAALLESMQEHSVTVGGTTHQLEEPFFVLATQNPIEQEGTYPLPEAQLDRFMLNLTLDYPSLDEEEAILASTTGSPPLSIEPVVEAETLVQIQKTLRLIPISQPLIQAVARFVQATRPSSPVADQRVNHLVRWGSGPRGGQQLILAAKVHAALSGRYHVEPEDLLALAKPVFRHRVLLNYHAQAEGLDVDTLIGELAAQHLR
ncbi:MAG: MoxR family ATPase [Planctomycetota bacterium]